MNCTFAICACYCSVFIILPLAIFGQQPTLEWVGVVRGPGSNVAKKVIVSSDGGVITVGDYRNAADFDPGPALLEFTAVSPFSCAVYIQKLDSVGSLEWTIPNFNISSCSSLSLCEDLDDNIYFAGEFGSIGDIGPRPERSTAGCQ